MQALSAPAAVIVAIAAIWATFKVDRDRRALEKERNRLKAGALAVAIYPELMELKAKAEGRTKSLHDRTQKLVLGPRADESDFLNYLKFGAPPNIDRSFHELWTLEAKAAAPVMQLLSILYQTDRMIEQLAEEIKKSSSFGRLRAAIPHLSQHVQMVQCLAEEALKEISPIHDRIIPGATANRK